jgi:hypothetical protein
VGETGGLGLGEADRGPGLRFPPILGSELDGRAQLLAARRGGAPGCLNGTTVCSISSAERLAWRMLCSSASTTPQRNASSASAMRALSMARVEHIADRHRPAQMRQQ